MVGNGWAGAPARGARWGAHGGGVFMGRRLPQPSEHLPTGNASSDPCCRLQGTNSGRSREGSRRRVCTKYVCANVAGGSAGWVRSSAAACLAVALSTASAVGGPAAAVAACTGALRIAGEQRQRYEGPSATQLRRGDTSQPLHVGHTIPSGAACHVRGAGAAGGQRNAVTTPGSASVWLGPWAGAGGVAGSLSRSVASR